MCFHVLAGGSVVCHDGLSMCIPRQNRLVNFMMPMWPRSALTRMHASVELALNSSMTAEPDRSWLVLSDFWGTPGKDGPKLGEFRVLLKGQFAKGKWRAEHLNTFVDWWGVAQESMIVTMFFQPGLICRIKSGLCPVLDVAVRLQGWNTGDTECGWDCGSPVPGFFLANLGTRLCPADSGAAALVVWWWDNHVHVRIKDWLTGRRRLSGFLSVNCYTQCQ